MPRKKKKKGGGNLSSTLAFGFSVKEKKKGEGMKKWRALRKREKKKIF